MCHLKLDCVAAEVCILIIISILPHVAKPKSLFQEIKTFLSSSQS